MRSLCFSSLTFLKIYVICWHYLSKWIHYIILVSHLFMILFIQHRNVICIKINISLATLMDLTNGNTLVCTNTYQLVIFLQNDFAAVNLHVSKTASIKEKIIEKNLWIAIIQLWKNTSNIWLQWKYPKWIILPSITSDC